MQPLTAARPFKAEGAAHVGGGRLAVWAAGDPESALCPCACSKESLGAKLGRSCCRSQTTALVGEPSLACIQGEAAFQELAFVYSLIFTETKPPAGRFEPTTLGLISLLQQTKVQVLGGLGAFSSSRATLSLRWGQLRVRGPLQVPGRG